MNDYTHGQFNKLAIAAGQLREIADHLVSPEGVLTPSPEQASFKAKKRSRPEKDWHLLFGPELYHIAEDLYEERSLRQQFLGDVYKHFGEAVWDLLLDLYISHYRNRPLSITSACIGARVPTTTGLRHIETLIQSGYACRIESETDKRRTYVRLTADGLTAMSAYLHHLRGRSTRAARIAPHGLM
jgi:hypothetical protein